MSNLSEEEKKAIEKLNEKYKFMSENPLATNVFTTLDTHSLGIILNLIDKKDKVIDLMAEHIVSPIITKEGKLIPTKNYEEIKEYFYRQVEVEDE